MRAGKAGTWRACASRWRCRGERVLAIGDGANDLAMMAEAGTSIAFHAKAVVRESATYALAHVGLEGVLGLFPA